MSRLHDNGTAKDRHNQCFDETVPAMAMLILSAQGSGKPEVRFSGLADNTDFCDLCDDDASPELECAPDTADGNEVRVTGIYGLQETEADIIHQAKGRAAAA